MTFTSKKERTNYIIAQIEEMIDCIESMDDAKEVQEFIFKNFAMGYITKRRFQILNGFARQAGERAEGTWSFLLGYDISDKYVERA